MLISAEMVPPSPQEPLAPPVFSEPPLQRRVSFRSKLHDFDSPVLKTWGKQQILRCLKVNRKGEVIVGNRRPDLIGPSADFPEQIRQHDNHVTISNDAASEGAKAKLLPQLRETAAPSCTRSRRVPISEKDNHVTISNDAGSEASKAKRLDQLHETAAPSCRVYEPEPNHQPEVLRAPFPCAPATLQSVLIPSSNFPSDVVQTCNLRRRRVPIRKKNNHITISNDGASEAAKPKLCPQLCETAALSCRIYEPEPNLQPEVLRASFPCSPTAPLTALIPSSNSLSDVAQPCNLRSRRLPIRKKLSSNASPPPPALEKNMQRRTVQLRSDKLEKPDYWPKISISLSRKEIEEDFIAMTGSRPPRRPNKRPKLIQRQLDQLFPGLSLPSISRATYNVPD